jgi:hypothetical protein
MANTSRARTTKRLRKSVVRIMIACFVDELQVVVSLEWELGDLVRHAVKSGTMVSGDYLLASDHAKHGSQ